VFHGFRSLGVAGIEFDGKAGQHSGDMAGLNVCSSSHYLNLLTSNTRMWEEKLFALETRPRQGKKKMLAGRELFG
jgi:hypothetical protein